MPPKSKTVQTPTKPAASAVSPSKPPSTSTPAPVKAPAKQVAPVVSPSNQVSVSTPAKQPQTPAPAGKWAQKLPALGASTSSTNSPGPGAASTTPALAPSPPNPIPKESTGTSSNKATPLDPNGILTFGDGVLDLAKAYEYNEEQIMNFLNGVTKPNREAQDVAKGIQMFLLTANNDKTKTLATWEYPKAPPAGKTPEEIAKPLTIASEAQLQGPNSLASVPSMPTRDSPLRRVGAEVRGNKDMRLLAFQGVNLPMITIYDYLAWLLSVLGSSETQSVVKTPQNYYLPLLALFSRWCTIISNLIKFESLPMVHISWWPKSVLLGATLGDVPEVPGQRSGDTRQSFYIAPRQKILDGLDYKQPPSDQDGKQSYGRCAETFMFIVAKIKKIPATSVQGFAMFPPEVAELPINQAISSGLKEPVISSGQKEQVIHAVPKNETSNLSYEEALKYQSSRLHLANPCVQSCQKLFGQLKWDWTKGFDVSYKKKQSLGVVLARKPSRDPDAPRPTPVELGVGGKGEGGKNGDYGQKPPDLNGKEPFNATVSANLTPGQRLGNTQALKDQNKKTYGKSSKSGPQPLSAANVTAAAGNLTPDQMVGSTVATIASSAVLAAAPAVLTGVAGMYAK